MLRHTLLKVVVSGLVIVTGFGITACTMTEARPAALTGQSDEPTHERHATGFDSQVSDM